MSSQPLTLMAVHAHPDDEASSTGGVLAKYSSEGITTVLVTCTNGEFGDGPGGEKPEEEGHNETEVVAHRRGELDASVKVLGIRHLELLGYRDSGMMGWTQNSEPNAFWNTPVNVAAERLAVLMEKYQPQVVVTYDERGFYGHPDHIQANRITLEASKITKIPKKLYYSAVPRSMLQGFAEVLRSQGIEPPEPMEEDVEFGTADELITTYVDCSSFVDRKYAALECHASQTANSFFLQMDKSVFASVFSNESFVRVEDSSGAPVPEDDLFAGLR